MNDSHNAKFFPEYIQVLQPVEEASGEWAGVSGHNVIATSRDEVKREVARVEQQVDAVEQKVDAMAAEMVTSHELIMAQLQAMAQQGADP